MYDRIKNDIRNAMRTYLASLPMMPGGREVISDLINNLSMEKEDFESRWTAD